MELLHTVPEAEKPQLDNLESQIMEIKSRLDTKPRRVTLASVDAKVDLIIKLLLDNGVKNI